MSILENQMTNFDLAMHNFETILNDLVTSESTQGFLQFRKEKESEIYYSDLLLLTFQTGLFDKPAGRFPEYGGVFFYGMTVIFL